MITSASGSLWLKAAREAVVWRRAARLRLAVGMLPVAVNQGDHWLHREIDAAVIAKTLLSPLLSFGIAFASAAATRVEILQRTASSS